MDSFTVELRDTGEYGFELPAEQIVPTGEEALAGLLAMVEVALAEPSVGRSAGGA
jgi:hypothetical protein